MSEMLQLRAWLVDSGPEVYRTLVLDPRLTLNQLHTALQIAFGWENYHLHQFHDNGGTRYGVPHESDPDVNDERKFCLGEVFNRKQKRIVYEYDFGDSWIHAVEFEKTVLSESIEYPFETFIKEGKGLFSGKKRAAMCINGALAGPPEDCGGIHGYFNMLKLKKNPKAAKSRDAKERLKWLGDWEPSRFDLSDVNQRLGRIRVKKAMAGK
ncbi:MAG: plasmid pRiA4b ORF-3 family protein [Phycisphaerales bacterium]|nr:plasmid pRiA4b ORF-3 family protein [Phycisphaerales bacterium]